MEQELKTGSIFFGGKMKYFMGMLLILLIAGEVQARRPRPRPPEPLKHPIFCELSKRHVSPYEVLEKDTHTLMKTRTDGTMELSDVSMKISSPFHGGNLSLSVTYHSEGQDIHQWRSKPFVVGRGNPFRYFTDRLFTIEDKSNGKMQNIVLHCKEILPE